MHYILFSCFQELRDQLKDRHSLKDYLILPVQRILKYNLLLQNILELSQKAGTPIPNMEAALEATREVSDKANNAVHLSMLEGYIAKQEKYGKLELYVSFCLYCFVISYYTPSLSSSFFFLFTSINCLLYILCQCTCIFLLPLGYIWYIRSSITWCFQGEESVPFWEGHHHSKEASRHFRQGEVYWKG